MSIKSFQDILPLVEQPSRYLGTEINSIKKSDSDIKLHFALAFPDLYEIGTSHFGIQILYHILNNHKDVYAERVFAPYKDMDEYLRKYDIPITSLESKRELIKFDIIGFSLLYELNYTNILTILDLSKIPFYASQRDLTFPLIIAGGPCTCNPEPISDFFDAIVIGDGEKVVLDMVRAWLHWKENKSDKETLLKLWSGIEGVYIPSFFKPKWDFAGFQIQSPDFSNNPKVTRAIFSDLNKATFPDKPIIPFAKPIHDRLRLEVSRGCTRGCRFCQAGMIYRPVRERNITTILDLCEKSILNTGYEDLSLLSLSIGDYGCITSLMEQLMARWAKEHVAVSFPSIRAGTLTSELMKLIKTVRKTGFTIAPEAGSQRLRDVINKNLTDQEIIDTVKDAFSLGWQIIKLYFMIGLPTETEEDLLEMVKFVKELRKIRGSKGRSQINFSVTTFVPKPHTPFQWASQMTLNESREKIRWLNSQLKFPGINFKFQSPEVSLLEGLFARGDRKLSRLLVSAYQKGCKFDGWSDMFKFNLWEDALSDSGLDINFYTTRKRELTEPLPWDQIDLKVTKAYLVKEWENAQKGQLTPDCRHGSCQGCGVCDFDEIKPVVYQTYQADEDHKDVNKIDKGNLTTYNKKLQIIYSRMGQAKYFGHLELVNIFLRAIRRGNIPIKFSEGFHPIPKISFDDPLPIGIESMRESFYINVSDRFDHKNIAEIINSKLPEGLKVLEANLIFSKSYQNEKKDVTYLITIADRIFDEVLLTRYYNTENEFIISRTNRKGNLKTFNLKEVILNIEMIDSFNLKITLKCESGSTIRPAEIINAIFKMSEEDLKLARIIKLVS